MLPDTQNMNCYEYLKTCVEKYTDHYMLQYGKSKYTKEDFFTDVDNLACYYQNVIGLKKGEVYTIFMPTCIQAIVGFYALNKIGVIINFLHPMMSSVFLEENLIKLKSKGIMIMDIFLKEHIEIIKKLQIKCLVCNTFDYSKRMRRVPLLSIEKKFIQRNNRTQFDFYKEAIKYTGKHKENITTAECVGFYLSGGGTTGVSKTIMLSSKAVNELALKASFIDKIYENGDEAMILSLPMFHCFGLCLGVHMSLCSGGRLIPMMKFNPKKFNKLLKKNHVVGAMGIPLMFKKIMNENNFDSPELKNFKFLFCGGDDVSDNFLDEFNSYLKKYGAVGRLRQGYGLTETCGVCCANTNANYKRGSVGKALKGINIEILDSNHVPLPNGKIGEIAVSGSTIMLGYFEKDIFGDGIYTDENGTKKILTGDSGYIDDDGYLFFTGRKKRIIIIAGYNIYPHDIEQAVSEKLSFVKEVCAVKGEINNKPIIRLFVSLKDNDRKKEEKYRHLIKDTCIKNLSRFSVPKEIIFLDELPHTDMMKIDFQKLENK